VLGKTAEAKSNKIRIIHDRDNLPNLGERDQLSYQGLGQSEDLLESHRGLRGTFEDEAGSQSAISPETGAGDRKASSGNGRDSRVTFPLKVKLAVGAIVASAFIFGFAIVSFIKWAVNLGVSHLSGFWWLLGGAAAYSLFCVLLFSFLRVSATSDRRIAEMGGQR
jgi:hypothetical protein